MEFYQIFLDGSEVFVVKIGKWGKLECIHWPHGVLRIHGSWAKPDV
jgi:hypothetical protein